MIFFSIIIPTYNSALTVQKCIESILNQTYKNFEILIIDGVSTDNTIEIIRLYNDSRINILSEPDKGIYDAMNKGIKVAKGEWTYFIGSDDSFYDENVLEYIFAEINKQKVDVIYGNVLMAETNKIYDGEFDNEKFLKGDLICHQAIFYRKKIHYDLGFYNTKYKVLADHNLNLKWFFSKKHKHAYINRIIANYSINGFSSDYKDTIFYNDLPEKLLCLGFREYNFKTLKELSIRVAIINKKTKHFYKYFIFKSLYFILRVLDLINRRFFSNKTLQKCNYTK